MMKRHHGKVIEVVVGMRRCFLLALVGSLMVAPQVATAQQPSRPAGAAPTFRSGVDLVTVAAVVRDGKGRLVMNLTRDDFTVIDSGRPQKIVDFRPGDAAISVAVLMDGSGSMAVSDKISIARVAAEIIRGALDPRRDELALFSFDTRLTELRGFDRAGTSVDNLLAQVEPFGMTSLYDAIAETAQRVAARGRAHGHAAVVVVTDGMDTGSALTPPEVSGIASAIDVPVYVLAVTSPVDDPTSKYAVTGASESPLAGELVDLARWTGGDAFVASQPSHAVVAVRRAVNELRYQYVIAFEPGGQPGWHPLELRMRNRRHQVRARGGYFANPSRAAGESSEVRQ